MVVYSFYVFDRHAECIYKKKWAPRPDSSSKLPISNGISDGQWQSKALSAEDDAKLIFGTIFSLRNMVRKLGGPDDNFISYRTSHYKLHYYETPTSLKFVMVTDTKTNNLRVVLHQIYVSLYVEYVVKNPLSPVEHPGGVGVNCELFELGVEQFVVSGPDSTVVHFAVLISAIADCISAELIELCKSQACWHTELITWRNFSLGFGMHTAQRPSAEVKGLERAVAAKDH